MIDTPRPGGLFDQMVMLAHQGKLPAPTILSVLLQRLGPIWPSRLTLGGIALGDCWKHPALKSDDATSELMPLHEALAVAVLFADRTAADRGHRGHQY